MIKGKTESGFSFKIEDAALDDWELLEDLMLMDEGNVPAIGRALERLLGSEQKKKLKEHLRGKNGRVSASAMVAEIAEIFKSTNEGKKS